MTPIELSLTILLLAACILAGWREWTLRNSSQADMPDYSDILDEIELVQKALEKQIDELHKGITANTSEMKKMSLEVSELYEFVDRNMKKMSARNQRAEELATFTKQLQDAQLEMEMPQGAQGNPNARPRIVRKQ